MKYSIYFCSILSSLFLASCQESEKAPEKQVTTDDLLARLHENQKKVPGKQVTMDDYPARSYEDHRISCDKNNFTPISTEGDKFEKDRLLWHSSSHGDIFGSSFIEDEKYRYRITILYADDSKAGWVNIEISSLKTLCIDGFHQYLFIPVQHAFLYENGILKLLKEISSYLLYLKILNETPDINENDLNERLYSQIFDGIPNIDKNDLKDLFVVTHQERPGGDIFILSVVDKDKNVITKRQLDLSKDRSYLQHYEK